MSENREVREMVVLEAMAWVAFRDPADPMMLAVVSEAWMQAGYNIEFLDSAGLGRDAALLRIYEARFRRNKIKLRLQARGLRRAIALLDDLGVLSTQAIALGRHPAPPLDAQALATDLLGISEHRVDPMLYMHGVTRVPSRD